MATPKKHPKAGSKETIYIDVDDEITNIIDKVKSSEHKIIALVLPKRASVLQSVVNMKLLKRAAVSNKKNLVLITSETGLLPLAGAAGLHVAKSLQSKPEIPPLPRSLDDETEVLEESDVSDADVNLDRAASIGTLAAAAKAGDDEVIELDNAALDTLPADTTKKSGPKKLKALRVPNFERFKLGFVLGIAAFVLLIVGWFLAYVVLPKATITIKTDTSTVVSSFDFIASKDQPELDVNDKKLPAVYKETAKTESVKVPATGQRDDGTKASGEVTLTAPCSTSFITVPAGTTVSTGGLNYITQAAAALNSISGGGPGSWVCSKTVDVLASENGDKYNIGSGKTFTVSGYSSASGKNGADIDGGTSKIVKIVAQKDIDDALAQITQRQGTSVSDELKAVIEAESKLALTETLKSTDPKVTASPEVGKEATEVTVTSEATHSMLGVAREDLVAVIKKDIEGEVDTNRQLISDDGIDTAIMRINNNTTPGTASLSFRTSVTAGPQLDETAIKEAIRGKKRGEVESYIETMPGVREAVVEYSPFWIFSTPKASKKIHLNIEKNDVQQSVRIIRGSNG